MDPEVEKWRQFGRIYLWRFKHRNPRDEHGWHIAADKTGCDDLERAVTLLHDARYPGRITFRVSENDNPPQIGRTDGHRNAKTFTISYDRAFSPDHWSIREAVGNVILMLGPDRLDELRAMIQDMRQGGSDYSIGGDVDAERLWLWWAPDAQLPHGQVRRR